MGKKRKTNLDLLRSLAAIDVAVYHVLANSVNSDPTVATATQTAIATLCAAMYWHVPVFYMITGYLWLSDNKECSYSKVLNNVRRFVLVLFTVGYGYAMMELVFTTRSLSPQLFLQGLSNVLQGKLWDHMWYVYAIIGIYLLLPVLKPFFAHNTVKTVSLFTGLLFLFTLLLPAMTDWTGFPFPVTIPVASSVFYVCAGGLLAKIGIPQIKKVSVPAAIVFLCSGTAAYLALFGNPDSSWMPLFNCICAVSIFAAVLGCFSALDSIPIIHSFADCSFGVYLFHQFFINLMFKLLHIYPMQHMPWISIPLTSIVIIGLSYVTTYLLRKIPPIKQYIL